MSLIPDELKTQTFPCPVCGNYINDETTVCKHCGSEISVEMREAAMVKERADRKSIALTAEKRIIYIGLIIFFLGFLNLLRPVFEFNLIYSSGQSIPCISPIAILFGSAVALYGLRGYFREKYS